MPRRTAVAGSQQPVTRVQTRGQEISMVPLELPKFSNRKMNEIARLWSQHESAEFPAECRGEELGGIDLVMLDADAAGCICSFLGCRGKLDRTRHEILRTCRSELETVVSQLVGRPQQYYSRLLKLSELVLHELPD